MIDNILFSIVIPTFNRATFIQKAVQSVLEQAYTNFEIIIVDDGSTDNTEEVIRNLNSNKIYYHKIENAERGYARNFGTLHAKGDYVTFLDSDDILLPQHFQNAFESIQKYKRPPFLHLGYEIVNSGNKVLYKIDNLRNDDINILVHGNTLSCAGCFLRTDVSRICLFNEDRNISGSEDWELWFRVLANYGIKADNRISTRMFNHENRSVVFSHVQEQNLVLRKELSLKYAFKDPVVQKRFGKHYRKIDAFADSYIALHLALVGEKKRSLRYLVKFIKSYPLAIFSIRFIVIIKYIILGFFKTKRS